MSTISPVAAAVARSVVLTLFALSFAANMANANAGLAIPADVRIGESTDDGPIYTSSDGMTLYTTLLDETPSGRPGCANTLDTTGTHHLGEKYILSEAMQTLQKSCVQRWPPFRPTPEAEPVGKWGIKSRPDGSRQWAYEGRYVYTSIRDKAPGDVHGAGGVLQDQWQTVKVPLAFPPGVALTRALDGLILASDDGQALFAPTAAVGTPSIEDWLPLVAPLMAESNGDWGIQKLDDGTQQWRYKDALLYLPGSNMSHARIRATEGLWDTVVYQENEQAPEPFHLQYTLAGWIYADNHGKSMYAFHCQDQTPDKLDCDEPGDPAVYRSSICGSGEDCARNWRPVLASEDARAAGDWAVGDVPHPPFADPAGAYGIGVPTVRAWTYRGRPVYTFSGDREPGDIHGHSIRYYGVSRFSLVKALGNARLDGERYFVDLRH